MKRRTIKQIARGFGWAAAVAGTLGLAHPAAAQTPPQKGYRSAPVVNGRTAPAAPAKTAVDPTTLRLVQTRVQMAWLADPTTFAYGLSLGAGPQGIQATGFVPNDGVRQRALQLARQHSGLPVADGLKVHPSQIVRCVGQVSGDNLRREALAALQETFGDRAAAFQVAADDRGRVTVAGPCASADEQLQVARSLRRAGHCACVTSQLTIGEVPPAVMAMAERAPVVEPALPKQSVVAWHPENSMPPPEVPEVPEVPEAPEAPEAPETKADAVLAKTEPAPPAAPAAPRLAPASFYESPKLAGVDALPAVPGKADGTPAEVKGHAEGEVYETTGDIQWETAPADGKNAVWSSNPDAKAAKAASATPNPADTAKVEGLIRARCGADLRDVRVAFLNDGRLHITLRVAANVDRVRVENAVRQIPDVAGYARGIFID